MSKTPGLTRESVLEYIHDEVFRLRPADYSKRYPKWPGHVGLEIEMLPINREGKIARLKSELHPRLQKLADQRGWRCRFNADASLLSIELPDQGMLSFEPGGQFEISTLPFPCLSEASHTLQMVQRMLDEELSEFDILQHGINPWQTTDEIGLQMDKPRYKAMDEYFASIGPFGRRMMRQTCTMQVNLDFGGDESTLAKRFLASNLMAPFCTAIFANSPVVNRQRGIAMSSRAEAWRHIDPSRSGFVRLTTIARKLDRMSCVEAYAEKVLKAPVIFIESLGYQRPEPHFSFEHWLENPYKGARPQRQDLMTHLSLIFPEVRARGFLELRSMDCPSRLWQDVMPLFCTALLYTAKATDAILDRWIPKIDELDEILQKATFEGLNHSWLASEAKWLMQLALDSVKDLPMCFQAVCGPKPMDRFADHFVMRGRSQAHDVLDLGEDFGPAQYRQLEARWLNSLNERSERG